MAAWKLVSDILPTEGDVCMVIAEVPGADPGPAPIDPDTGLPVEDWEGNTPIEVQVCFYTNHSFIGFFGHTFDILQNVLAFKPVVLPTNEEMEIILAEAGHP